MFLKYLSVQRFGCILVLRVSLCSRPVFILALAAFNHISRNLIPAHMTVSVSGAPDHLHVS